MNPMLAKRSYKYFDPDEFTASIQQLGWLDVYLCTDVDRAVRLLSNKITTILDRMAPIKTVLVRTNYNLCLSQKTKDLMKERDDTQKQASLSNNPDQCRKYKQLRNRVTSRLRSEKKNWQRFKLAE